MPHKKPKSSAVQPSLAHIPPPEKGARPDAPQTAAVKPPMRVSELFIVDNSDAHWKGADYLREWCEIARALDIATGYFEIGALLALDGHWQKLEQIRILMGDEASKRTHDAFRRALSEIEKKLDASLEHEKDRDDFLRGVPAIVAALQSGKIICKVYRERKFHAKAYITHGKFEVMGSTALVGSSNFTRPGLTENIELNVRLRSEVELLQEWYEQYWAQAEDVTPELVRVIERHVREYSPFEVYVKALAEYFKGHELTPEGWEKNSAMYRTLDYYQKEAYHALLKRGAQYRGALLADSVGLGKTFIGMMLIARLLREGKKVALLVPKSANQPVWRGKLERFLPDALGSWSGLRIYNHTDLLRGGDYIAYINDIGRNADVILIDEAHHFRNRAAKTYKKLASLTEGKTLYLLTATPINNSLLDLQHLIELFARRDGKPQADYFQALGVHSLAGHFRKLESAVKKLVGETDDAVEITADEAERLLKQDALFQALVVQRSRAYARSSSLEHGGAPVVFPKRHAPAVVGYSLARTYGPLLSQVDRAFKYDKSQLAFAMYNPLAYSKKKLESADERWVANRQNQLVGLIRVQLLKRFESSARAFQATCQDLLLRLLAFAQVNSKTEAEEERLEEWQARHTALLQAIRAQRPAADAETTDEDAIPAEFLENAEELSRSEYKLSDILDDTFHDLDQLAEFLNDLQDFEPARDDKLQKLIAMLRTDPSLSRHKVLIFTEYMATARYLAAELKKAGIAPLDQVDSASARDRGEIITDFSPYYNESSSSQLALAGRNETRVLISTDVLSEGLNLQDATLLINYDLHWNPVRLMQRIGRVDRRLDPAVEARMLADHPEYKNVRGDVRYWNFLPPDELDELLRLYERVAHKTLRISKVFGIEGKKLLTPQDDFDALKEFNEAYEGAPSPEEALRLAFRDLLAAHPDLERRLAQFPLRVFSAQAHPHAGKQAVFFSYQLPAKNLETNEWDNAGGRTQWYLIDASSEEISEDALAIEPLIRATPETPRRRVLSDDALTALRRKVEAHIKATYLKAVQAPAGVKPVLKAWMELN